MVRRPDMMTDPPPFSIPTTIRKLDEKENYRNSCVPVPHTFGKPRKRIIFAGVTVRGLTARQKTGAHRMSRPQGKGRPVTRPPSLSALSAGFVYFITGVGLSVGRALRQGIVARRGGWFTRVGPIAAVSLADEGEKAAIANRCGAHHPEHVDGAAGRTGRRLCPFGVEFETAGRVHHPRTIRFGLSSCKAFDS